jgi:hypothetical protein
VPLPSGSIAQYRLWVLAATDTSMIKARGFEPTSVGGSDQSVRIEPFGNLHQFGKLGKLVTAKEAVAAL